MSLSDRYCLDSNVIIAIVQHPAALQAPRAAFVASMAAGKLETVTSELTLAECLTKPFADDDDETTSAFLAQRALKWNPLEGGKLRQLICLSIGLVPKVVSTFGSDALKFLVDRPELPMLPVSRNILVSAAQQRANTRMKLPDAIHLATALFAGCSIFLTSDRRVRLPPGMKLEFWHDAFRI